MSLGTVKLVVSFVCIVVIVMMLGLSWDSKRLNMLCNDHDAGAAYDRN